MIIINKRTLTRRIYIPLLLLVVLLGANYTSYPLTVQTGSFQVDLTGKKTWDVNFGAGDPASLSESDYPANSLSLDQSLVVNLSGSIEPYFTLSADLDDSDPGYLQEFKLKMDTDNWDGVLGDFVVGQEDDFTVYNKKLLGVRLSGEVEGSGVEVMTGRLQGISETKVFYGKTAVAEINFSLFETEEELVQRGYRTNIRGLEYYNLTGKYVEGFTEPALNFLPEEDLWNFLGDWGLEYLEGPIEEEKSKDLTSSQFRIIDAEGYHLVLLTERLSLLRSRIKSYISTYNDDLPEEEQKEYPFNEGTDYERKFLKGLQDYVRFVLGDEEVNLADYRQNRFYALGETSIEENSVEIRVFKEGGWVPIEDLPDYDYDLYSEKGIIDLEFPGDFFTDLGKKEVEISYKYNISGNIYMLGFSVTPNSERVYLNGKLLKRNTDYSIDYETGSLMLFKSIGPDDELKVDYERARGGIGGFAEYPRNLYGGKVNLESDYGLEVSVSAFQARDEVSGEIPIDIPIMPNVHTVGGLEATFNRNGWNANLRASGSINEFPFDDNERKNLPNRINDIVDLSGAGYEVTVFGHQDGFAVEDGGEWLDYGPGDGLAGNVVQDGLLVDSYLVFAANSGITTIQLEGESPFDRAVNWKSYYDLAGLEEVNALSLASDGETIWAGTTSGLIAAEVGDLAGDDPWGSRGAEFFADAEITDLAYFGDYLWIATADGLQVFDPEEEELVGPNPQLSEEVIDMSSGNDYLYAVTPGGIFEFDEDLEERIVVEGSQVTAVSASDGEVWYGTESGFSSVSGSSRYGDREITAISAGQGIWAGSKGFTVEDEYDITAYSLLDVLKKYSSEETGIPGQDDNRFKNIDADTHTDRGIALEGRLDKTFELWSREFFFSTGFGYTQPAYSEIGRFDQRDSLSAKFTAGGEIISGLDLELSRDYSLSTLTAEEPGPLVTNTALLVIWDGFVKTDAEVYWQTRGEESRDLGLDLFGSKSFWDDRLTVSLGLSGLEERDLQAESSTLSAGLTSSLSASPFEGINATLNYAYPLRFEPFSTQDPEKMSWTFSASRGVPLGADYGVKVQLNGEGDLDDLFSDRDIDFTNSSQLSLDFDKLTLGAVELSPGSTVEWDTSNKSNEFSGELSGKLSVSDFSSRLSLSRKMVLPTDSELVKFVDQVSGKLSYSLQGISPTLNYGLDHTSLTHPSYGSKTKLSGKVGLTASWQPISSLTNELKVGINYKDEKGFSYTVSDVINWKAMDDLTPQLSVDAEYVPGTGDLDLTSKATANYPFLGRWGLSFTSGLNWGLEESGESYFSFFGSTGLKVDF
ncbi:MAG: hypothetical protein ACOC88_00125 [Candidatus Bipolaricaulota bacterium]